MKLSSFIGCMVKIQAADDYLSDNEAVDAALIFKTEAELDQTLYFLIGNSYVRVMVIFLEEPGSLDRLSKMRPSPNYFLVYGTTATLTDAFRHVLGTILNKLDDFFIEMQNKGRWLSVMHGGR